MWLLIVIVILNIISFAGFGSDKLLAKLDWQRIAEKSLYILIILGPVGALFGMSVFRHKISKTSFKLKAAVPFILGFLLLFATIYLYYF